MTRPNKYRPQGAHGAVPLNVPIIGDQRPKQVQVNLDFPPIDADLMKLLEAGPVFQFNQFTAVPTHMVVLAVQAIRESHKLRFMLGVVLDAIFKLNPELGNEIKNTLAADAAAAVAASQSGGEAPPVEIAGGQAAGTQEGIGSPLCGTERP